MSGHVISVLKEELYSLSRSIKWKKDQLDELREREKELEREINKLENKHSDVNMFLKNKEEANK